MVNLRRDCNGTATPKGLLREMRDGVMVAVRAQPGAKKTGIVGVYGEGEAAQLKIAVHAPPVEGRANQALIEFLSALFRVARRDVVLVSGDSSRSKVFLMRGVSITQAQSALQAEMG